MLRGEIWWAEIPEGVGSVPAYRRPVLIIQSDAFNRSRIASVIAVAMTSNLALAEAPGNLRLSRTASGLPKDSVVNVSQLVTLDRSQLSKRVGRLPATVMRTVDEGLRLSLDL